MGKWWCSSPESKTGGHKTVDKQMKDGSWVKGCQWCGEVLKTWGGKS